MRGSRKCETCNWFEDKSEEFSARYVSADGMCHWRLPATLAKDSQGWGSWHQKGSAAVRKEDWCSCWEAVTEHNLDAEFPHVIPASRTQMIEAK